MRKFKQIVEKEFQKDYYKQLHQYIENEYQTKTIYPPKQQIFRALNLCDYDDVKVVILGQDPYHEPNQANGLAFSVTKDVKQTSSQLTPPASFLKNMAVTSEKRGGHPPAPNIFYRNRGDTEVSM